MPCRSRLTCDRAQARRRGRAACGTDPRFDQILASANDAIISIDEAQTITLFNRGAERIFGYSAVEMIGQPLDRLIPERFVARHGGQVRDFLPPRRSRE